MLVILLVLGVTTRNGCATLSTLKATLGRKATKGETMKANTKIMSRREFEATPDFAQYRIAYATWAAARTLTTYQDLLRAYAKLTIRKV